MWMFNPSFRKAVQDGDEAEIGRLLVEETGHTPQGEGFAACDEWEDALSRRAGRT